MTLETRLSESGDVCGRCAKTLILLFPLILIWTVIAQPITVRTKSDLRLWETVTDRARPLSWPWVSGTDEAELTFSNRLTAAVSSVTVPRMAGTVRGTCSHPVAETTDEGLVVATLVQMTGDVEIARETAVLAYVPGVRASHDGEGSVVTQPMTLRTKAERAWWRVRRPRLSAIHGGFTIRSATCGNGRWSRRRWPRSR